ncbi:unnamed protein product, partial [Amoebophrya sp. A25]
EEPLVPFDTLAQHEEKKSRGMGMALHGHSSLHTSKAPRVGGSLLVDGAVLAVAAAT